MEKFSIPSGTLTLVVIHATFLMFSLHFAKLSNFHQDISISMIVMKDVNMYLKLCSWTKCYESAAE